MESDGRIEILLVTAPGLEAELADEARAKGFVPRGIVPGGVRFRGRWQEVWRANLELRGVVRVLARLGAFHAVHLSQLDKKARAFPWRQVLREGVPVSVEASCKGSRLYHSGAVAERIAGAITASIGAPVAVDAPVRILARVEDDLCTLSVDTSGESLHKRGHKAAVGKAPLRETMAALFLRQCGYEGQGPVVDPMCGAGTLIIEAAEIAANLNPGRSRQFAFEQLATFDPPAFDALQQVDKARVPDHRCYGFDRDAGAIRMSTENARRAGVADFAVFKRQALSDLKPPEAGPGLVIVNPPYGARIGERKALFGLYGALGKVLREGFSGWRVGLITSDAALAGATGLPFLPAGKPVLHGGLRIQCRRTEPLP